MSSCVLNKVLLIKNKHYGANPEWGISPTESLLVDTFVGTGFAQRVEVFYFDILSQQYGRPNMDELLLDYIAGDRPDLVIFEPLGMFGIDPSRNAINTISKILGIRVYMARFDSIGPEGHRFTNSWFPFVSYIGFSDSTLAHLGYTQHPKAIQALPCVNAKYFHDKNLKRDIDVSFIGSVPTFLRREEYIQFLREHGITVITRGGIRYDRLTWEEYAELISRSKISLNFCLQGCGFTQIKSRVLEILACRTFMIEDLGIETKEFLEEGTDFVMAYSKEDMLNKILYYLQHDEERERIAKSGYRKATELYNSQNIWGYIFSKMDFGIPDNLAGDKYYQQLCSKMESLRYLMAPVTDMAS